MTETWEEAILAVMRRRRHYTWSLQEIYVDIETHPIMTPHHRSYWGSQPNYHHWVRSALSRLKAAGRVIHVGRALYKLPP